MTSESKRGLLVHNAPSLTIESQWNRPVQVKWINELVDGNGNYLPHLLPVDPTLHWANPPGGVSARDTRPVFDATPAAYTGPVPIVTHVHGAVGVGDESDGYAEAWFLPKAKGIPDGYATTGTWYDFFATKAFTNNGTAWGPGFATFTYPNLNRASTIWYHDHAIGMTRLNVYAGPAGFYIVRGGPDDTVLDTRTGARGGAAGSRPEGRRRAPVQQDLLRDPHRHPGPHVHAGRVAVLPGQPHVLRRDRPGPTSRRSATTGWASRRSGTRSTSAPP